MIKNIFLFIIFIALVYYIYEYKNIHIQNNNEINACNIALDEERMVESDFEKLKFGIKKEEIDKKYNQFARCRKIDTAYKPAFFKKDSIKVCTCYKYYINNKVYRLYFDKNYLLRGKYIMDLKTKKYLYKEDDITYLNKN